MSLQSVQEFMKSAANNPALMAEVSKITSNPSPNTASEIAAVGKREGFDFTPEEAEQAREMYSQRLSEDELDAVAGGGSDGGAIEIGVGTATGILAGELVPGGGGIIGAGVGAAAGGASASDCLAAGAIGAAQNMQETQSTVQQIISTVTSGW